MLNCLHKPVSYKMATNSPTDGLLTYQANDGYRKKPQLL